MRFNRRSKGNAVRLRKTGYDHVLWECDEKQSVNLLNMVNAGRNKCDRVQNNLESAERVV